MADNSNTGEIYAAYMAEIKWRLGETDIRLKGVRARPNGYGAILETELCYLQIRYVCELVALASLAAHHSYGLNKDLLKQHHAAQIFAELEGINALSFPVPVSLGLDENGMKQFTPALERGMPRQAFSEIYGKCGNHLHRGFLKHALKGKGRTYDVDELSNWHRSFVQLITQHLILFPQEERVVLVNLIGGPDRRRAWLRCGWRGASQSRTSQSIG